MGLGVYIGKSEKFIVLGIEDLWIEQLREMVGSSSQIMQVIVYVKLRHLDFYFLDWDHQVR